jgi:hypothetical protein
LWKYDSGRLKNKNGDWMFMEKTWTFTNENGKKKGQVIRDSFGRVLKVDSEDLGSLDVKLQTDDRAGLEVRKTSERGFTKLFSYKTKQADMIDDEQSKQLWIRKEGDGDGYFLLQSIERQDMFLTAMDASSLTIASK